MDVIGAAAIVTGGSSGLGAAAARALAAKGARVAILDLNDAGEALATEIGGIFARCDVTDESSVLSALALASAAHGAAKILVNCAGIGGAGRVVGRDGPLPLESFEKIIRVNLIGTFNVMRLAAAEMSLANAGGVIISTASVAAFEGQIGQAAYAASKGGIAALTLPVARELARFGIRVLTIAPGLFRTPLLEGLSRETQDALGAAIPFPARLGDPAEFAQLVVAMVENDYLNGETVRLDGALRMQPK